MGGLRLRILAAVWADWFQTDSSARYYTRRPPGLQRPPPLVGLSRPLARRLRVTKRNGRPWTPKDERVTIMLVLSRKRGEKIVFPELGVEFMVVDCLIN